jgi:hypothetical protein
MTDFRTSRRSLLASVPAVALAATPAMATLLGGLPASPSNDPIFAIIAEHRRVMRAWMDAFTLEDMSELGSPEERAARDLGTELCHRQQDMVRAVLTVQPTTIAGVAALLEHVGQDEDLDMCDRNGDARQTILGQWGDQKPEKRQIALDFPLRLAAALRSIIERGRS